MEFEINEYLSLKLENGETVIYVGGEPFDQCKFLVFEIPITEIISLDKIESIDEMVDKHGNVEKEQGEFDISIPIATQFWAHCSNLQAWYENNYNTRILHSNLAFPLLEKLKRAGDLQAKEVFKTEIINRFKIGHIPSIYFLIVEKYVSYLDNKSLKQIYLENNPKLKQQLENWDENLSQMITMICFKLFNWGDQTAEVILMNNPGGILELDLSNCELKQLSKGIGAFTTLEILNLGHNRLTKLPEEIGKLSSLKRLEICSNQLIALPEIIGELNSLESLGLIGNKLTSLPNSMRGLVSLKSLWLSSNKFTIFPEIIGNLSNLETLYMGNNNFSVISKSLCNLSALEWLSIDHGKLSRIPDFFGDLVKLRYLNLSFNQIMQIPENIGDAISLNSITLSYNQLTSIPISIGKLSNLKDLNLSKNQLISLPVSIGDLKEITKLDVSQNLLTVIPKTLMNLRSLRYLFIWSNKLKRRTNKELKIFLKKLREQNKGINIA